MNSYIITRTCSQRLKNQTLPANVNDAGNHAGRCSHQRTEGLS